MPSTRYNIVLLCPAGYIHSQGLHDVCRLLHCTFESLGYPVNSQVNRLQAAAINVVVGYHLAANADIFGNHRVIFYQLEQLSERDGWFNPQRLEVLRRAEQVWDYSPENAAFLTAKGLKDIRLLPLGFHEKLMTIAPATKDLDVLFYGSIKPRRRQILEELNKHCRLGAVFGVYGPQRDALIARSRIILNMHNYSAQILEQVRITYLLNNGCCVVSEDSALNPLQGMIVTAPYEKLVETCLGYLADEPRRLAFAAEAQRLFRLRPMTDYLRAILP